MHAILLTVLTLPAAGPGYGEYPPGSGEAGHLAAGEAWGGHVHGKHGGCLGPMPQSCYNPSFGCYPSTRFMHRYPAFHGYYYRQAYNYRHYFDYPWHAGLHEPTSHFSYNVPPQSTIPDVPIPPITGLTQPTRSVRTASSLAPVVGPQSVQR